MTEEFETGDKGLMVILTHTSPGVSDFSLIVLDLLLLLLGTFADVCIVVDSLPVSIRSLRLVGLSHWSCRRHARRISNSFKDPQRN